MSYYAADAVGDAWEATRAFLTPIEWRRWLRLAVVVFFLGGPAASLGNVNGLNAEFPTGVDGPDTVTGPVTGDPTGGLSTELLVIVAVVVALVVLVGLVFGAIGAIMEFVFVESLITGDVTVRRYWGRHWRRGLRLFGFRLAVGAVSLVIVGLAVAVIALPVLTGMPGVGIAALLLLLPVFAVIAIGAGLVNGFTRVFVVPVMIQRECGVLAGWRRLWGVMRGQWAQFGVYAAVGFVLALAGGVATGIAVGLLGVLAAIPFAIVAVLGAVLLGVESVVGIAVLIAVGLVFLAVLLGLFGVVQVPVMTYLRYVALFVLGDAAPELDPIPERRAAVRDNEPDAEPA